MAPAARLPLLLVTGWIVLWSVAADAGGLSLDRLVSRLALKQAEITRAFVERRQSGLLSEPVVLRGELTLRRDGSLSKHTRGDDGRVSDVRIDGNTVTLRNADGEQRFLLGRSDTLAALVHALRALMEGDAGALRAGFDTSLTGTADDWRLRLASAAPAAGLADGAGERGDTVTVSLSGDCDGILSIRLEGGGQRIKLELKTVAP